MSIIGLIAGQGCQHLGMGKDFKHSKYYKIAKEITGIDFYELSQSASEEDLIKTKITQPLLFVYSAAILEKMDKINFRAVMGHSLGEYGAVFLAGGFSFEDGLKIVRDRGELMQQVAEKIQDGAMAAIVSDKLNEDQILEICNSTKCYIANYNSSKQIAISGKKENIDKAITNLKELGYRAMLLKVNVPFHCSLLEEIVEEFKEKLNEIKINDAKIPIIANVAGRPIRKAEEIKKELIDQIPSPVRCRESIQYIAETYSNSMVFVEIGTKNATLTKFLDCTIEGRRFRSFFVYDNYTIEEFNKIFRSN